MKIILINTHFQSGSSILYESLSSHALIQGCKLNRLKSGAYLSDFDLTSAFFKQHSNKRILYLDEIFVNQSLSTRLNFKNVFIVNFIRRPKETLESLIEIDKMKPINALRYYQYRLNRIYQISKKAQNCLFFKFESLKYNGAKEVMDFLGLENTPKINMKILEELNKPKRTVVAKDIISMAEKRYEYYHWLLSSVGRTT